jgi:uncharacterized protein with PQ loop repeat
MKDLIYISSGILMTFCYLFCGVPQIIKTFKTKSAKDISIWSVCIVAVGHASAIVYASFGYNNFWLFVCYFGGLVTAATMLYLWIRYGK